MYQVSSNGAPGVQNGPAAGGLGFKNKKYLKIFTKFVQMVPSPPGFKMVPLQGLLGLNHRNRRNRHKVFKKSSEPLGSVLNIWFCSIA